MSGDADLSNDGAATGVVEPDYMPARMVNEFTYCPRLFYYEHVDRVFAHNADTIEGTLRHAKVDAEEGELPPADESRPTVTRSVTLSSDRLGVIAKIDVVESDGTIVVPVDYKKGRPRETDDGPEAWPADRVQVGVQALILRDNGYRVDDAVLYYSATRQRVTVHVDEALIEEVTGAITGAKALASASVRPPPLVDSPKCPRCSLVGICLPDETLALDAALEPEDEAPDQLALFNGHSPTGGEATGGGATEVRQLLPVRMERRPLYVTGHGLTIGKSSAVLKIKTRDAPVQDVRMNELCQVNVFGNVQITAAALHGLCEAEIPVSHFSYGGWFYGLTTGLGLKNVFLRRAQFALAEVPWFRVSVARRIVHNKIRNQRTLLKRNHVDPPSLALQQLKRYADAALACRETEKLLGIEGTAARVYFEAFSGMLKTRDGGSVATDLTFDFEGRNRRPPRDPVNAMLSFAYSMLAKDLTIVCHAVGFDPFIGFYHEPRFGRPALALDLMEAFRPLIADSSVITAINTQMVTVDDFIRAGDSVALTAKGRKGFLRAYEQRMDTLVTHPIFGYRISYRRVLEVQTRLLARTVSGEIPAYPGFETR